MIGRGQAAITALVRRRDVWGIDEPTWLRFERPQAVHVAWRHDQVLPVLEAVRDAAQAGGYAVGFLTYEASPAFDDALVTRPAGALPLAWWAVFDRAAVVDLRTVLRRAQPVRLAWKPEIDADAHRDAVARIHAAIARGDTYQVNYTFRLSAPFDGDPYRLFLAMARAQRGAYAAYIDTGRFALCSASPELFLSRDAQRVVTRPMKGTARRGRTLDEDRAAIRQLATSEKDRAENLMIVDMMRNDLGRVAHTGSVVADDLFAIETYPTVHQMTSTVRARTAVDLPHLLRALFPCASITGAPKVATMRLIRDLESSPRGGVHRRRRPDRTRRPDTVQRRDPHGDRRPSSSFGPIRHGRRHRLGLDRQPRIRRVPRQGADLDRATAALRLARNLVLAPAQRLLPARKPPRPPVRQRRLLPISRRSRRGSGSARGGGPRGPRDPSTRPLDRRAGWHARGHHHAVAMSRPHVLVARPRRSADRRHGSIPLSQDDPSRGVRGRRGPTSCCRRGSAVECTRRAHRVVPGQPGDSPARHVAHPAGCLWTARRHLPRGALGTRSPARNGADGRRSGPRRRGLPDQ